MRNLTPPFRFKLDELISTARRKIQNRVDGIQITLPFVSFNVHPNDVEQKVVREIVIWIADRRVLNSSECCDNCIEEALKAGQTAGSGEHKCN